MSWRTVVSMLPGSIDHRRQLLRARCGPGLARARTAVGRLGVWAASVPTRRRRPDRRGDLDRVLDALPAPTRSDREVAVLVLDRSGVCRRQGSSHPDAAVSAAPRPGAELVCVALDEIEPLDLRWLDRLAAPIGGLTVAATPAVVHPDRGALHATPYDLLVREVGLRLGLDKAHEPTLEAVDAGAVPGSPLAEPGPVAAASSCLLVDRVAYDEVGGVDQGGDPRAAIVDLALRLRAGGGVIAPVPDALVLDRSPVASLEALRRPVAPPAAAWRQIVGRHGPALRREASPVELPPRLAITTAAPPGLIARRWGDWELAEGLARALGRLGIDTRVQTRDQAELPVSLTSDVHLVVRGLRRIPRAAGQRHVLWVISNPDRLEEGELDEADLVLAASRRLAEALRARTSVPVEVLLQGTDQHRFRPVPARAADEHPVTVVANARGMFRPCVAYALETGLRPAIYGDGWEQFVDRSLIVARHVPNDRLPTVYSSAGLILNDHSPAMREWGMVSNRIYDVLACGTPIVSDFLPELGEQLGDAVPTYSDPDELHDAVVGAQAEPEKARRRSAEGRRLVLANHTLDRRAAELVELLRGHGLLDGR